MVPSKGCRPKKTKLKLPPSLSIEHCSKLFVRNHHAGHAESGHLSLFIWWKDSGSDLSSFTCTMRYLMRSNGFFTHCRIGRWVDDVMVVDHSSDVDVGKWIAWRLKKNKQKNMFLYKQGVVHFHVCWKECQVPVGPCTWSMQ